MKITTYIRHPLFPPYLQFIEIAARHLGQTMAAHSEHYMAAGWLGGLEFDLWDAAHNESTETHPKATFPFTALERSRLLELWKVLGGWVIRDESDTEDSLRYLPYVDWFRHIRATQDDVYCARQIPILQALIVRLDAHPVEEMPNDDEGQIQFAVRMVKECRDADDLREILATYPDIASHDRLIVESERKEIDFGALYEQITPDNRFAEIGTDAARGNEAGT